MSTATTAPAREHGPSARTAGLRPGADWTGWAGYAPTVRGPELRRARAVAAGLLDPSPLAEPHRCSERRRSGRTGDSVVRFDPARRVASAPRATPPQRPRATLM